MKNYVDLWEYLAEFFLKWEMFQPKFAENIKTQILCSITVFRKSCRLWDNVEKYDTATQATDNNIIRRMRIACWISKATGTDSEYAILIAFPQQQWLHELAPMSHSYVRRLAWSNTVTGFSSFQYVLP
jgi:hypothetical protein